MSAARSTRSLFSPCLTTASHATRAIPCRQFHSSAGRPAPRRPRFSNVKAIELGLTTPEKVEEYAKDKFPEYTAEEKELLKKKYTPEQLAAIEAGEKAIDVNELLIQGRLRTDPYTPQYLEDYATVQPGIDWRPEVQSQTPLKFGSLPQSFDEWVKDMFDTMVNRTKSQYTDRSHRALVRALRKVKETNAMVDLTEEELQELENDPEAAKKYLVANGAEAADEKSAPQADEKVQDELSELLYEINAQHTKEMYKLLQEEPLEPTEPMWKSINPADSILSPDLGKLPGVAGEFARPRSEEEERSDPTGEYAHMSKVTGLKIKEMQGLVTKVLVRRYVHNQTRLGKIRSISVVTVAGNGNGWLGVGHAKSTEGDIAELTSKLLAIKSMKPVRRYENRTIFGNVTRKVSGTVVELRSRPPGFGLRVSHRIFEMCRMAGIHDLSAKIPRSRNPFNTVHACYQALMNQPDPEEIAIGRGKKLVDARKVYYGGTVL